MPKEDNKVLKYNHREKSMKVPFIIYADLESLLEKMSTCHNNPKKSSETKINKHTPSGYSLLTYCSFDATKNKLDKSYKKQKVCYICKKGLSTDDDNKKIIKSKVIVIILGNIEELLIVFVI